jgi:hypothetical protein
MFWHKSDNKTDISISLLSIKIMAETTYNKETMRSVIFDGQPYEVNVRSIPKASIVKQTDVVVRVTTAAICGSDLHNYHGVFGSSEVPYSLGHEAMGIVERVGSGVEIVKVGDRVLIPDCPDNGLLDVKPEIIPALSVYGQGEDLGNLGGCQCKFKLRQIIWLLTGNAPGHEWIHNDNDKKPH